MTLYYISVLTTLKGTQDIFIGLNVLKHQR